MSTLKIFITLLFVVALFSSPPLRSQPDAVSKKELQRIITFLASDSMKGRFTGTAENLIAAYSIAAEFKKAGLTPILTQRPLETPPVDTNILKRFGRFDSLAMYFQKFFVTKSRQSEQSSLYLQDKNGGSTVKKKFNMAADYYIQYSSQSSLEIEAPLVFCGFGIDNGPNGYNDYKSPDGKEIDVKGKIVVLMEGYPGQNDTASAFQKKRSPVYLNPLRKADVAQDRGALAVIMFEPRKDAPQSFDQRYERFERTLRNSTFRLPSRSESSIPIVFVSRKVAREIISLSSRGIDSMFEAAEKNLKPQPFLLGTKSAFVEVRFDVTRISAQNVIGILPGTDPLLQNEYILVGAHYDHVGLGEFGAMSQKMKGQVHNGADDNASGTAGVAHLASVLSKTPMRRSVIFVGWAAEDVGLLGSSYYANDQPVKPLQKTVAVVNLDMISRNEDSLLWVGGAFYSKDIVNIVEEANKDEQFILLYNTGMLNFASDQGPFLRKEIPAIFFFCGLHDDYHTPYDDVEKISMEKFTRVARLAAKSIVNLANGDKKPKYEETSMDERMKIVKLSQEKQKRFKNQIKEQSMPQQGEVNEK